MLVFTAGTATVQAADHSSTKSSASSPPTCNSQPNLNDPTNSSTAALASYYFVLQHSDGHSESVCSLGDDVQPGDTVTAHFTFASNSSGSEEVTLVSYTKTEGSKQQTMSDCESFSQGTDTDTSDGCSAAGQAQLTVSVPNCDFQIDFIYGEAIASLTPGPYSSQHRLISSGSGGEDQSCSSTTPSPTSSVSGITTSAPGSSSGSGSGAASSSVASGVSGISTPGTGSGLGALRLALGLLLIVGGVVALLWGGWRRATEI
ncbi:MAG: hypothetical protein JOZ46_09905 [Candidatus Dormibacteraeota bacterium]|nr:hypothetical protein [Candidatus Dormibacteraeota bacterium]MBV9526111.1 hypothetical protein [Candidatus Dormibacteraeota bacterium]